MNLVVAFQPGTGDTSETNDACQLAPHHDSPILSISESTPTHTECTEGTPSFTMSSPSCSSDILGTQFWFILTVLTYCCDVCVVVCVCVCMSVDLCARGTFLVQISITLGDAMIGPVWMKIPCCMRPVSITRNSNFLYVACHVKSEITVVLCEPDFRHGRHVWSCVVLCHTYAIFVLALRNVN